MRSRTLFLVAAAGVVCAVFAYLGTGLHPIWWALWLAPIPVLAIAPRLGAGVAFLFGSIAWLIGETNQWNYVRYAIELPLPITVLYFLTPAIVFGIGVLLVRNLIRRGSLFFASLIFPVYWVAYEYLTAITSPHSTWGNLAYTQMNCLPVIQIASITGLWGISFIVLLFASGGATLLSGAGNTRQHRMLAIAVGFIVCVVFVFGKWRLQSNPSDNVVTVTLIAKDVPMSVYLGSEEQALQVLNEYADEIRRVSPAGTDVVVLPEKIARVSEGALAEVNSLYSSVITVTHTAVLLGLVRKTPSGDFNSSRFYSAHGKLEANYDKHHLIPGVEPETPGDKRVILEKPSGRWGLQICKDMDFPKLSREYAAEGANLLLVPAWDFNLDGWLHARMAILRAVENGFALARSARNGLLTLSDSRGRILAQTATVPDRFVSVTGKVNISREQTFYTRTGDWFAWLCVAVFVGLLAFQLFSREGKTRS
jgi:apolipoprotein N-acyltransferase